MLTGEVFGKPVLACRIAILKTREAYDVNNLRDATELTELAEYAYSL